MFASVLEKDIEVSTTGTIEVRQSVWREIDITHWFEFALQDTLLVQRPYISTADRTRTMTEARPRHNSSN